MSRGVRCMLDEPDPRAMPGDLRRRDGQSGNEAEQVERHLVGHTGGRRALRHPTR